MSQPYDPYVRNNEAASNAGSATKDPRMAEIQAQISDTTDVMRSNLEAMAERGESIQTLEGKTNNLSQSAQGFRRGANRVRKQMWWKDMKMRIAIGVGIAVIVLVIVLPIVFKK